MATDRQLETNKTPINKIKPNPGDKRLYLDRGFAAWPKLPEKPKKVHLKDAQVPTKHGPFIEERGLGWRKGWWKFWT
jgi:hypothetical protein